MAYDPVRHPSHYEVYPVQPIQITRHLGFCLGNATKYVLRAPYKGGVEDCDKAIRYLELEKEKTQAPLKHHEYECCHTNVRKLVNFLVHAKGDILFGDIADCQIAYLDQLISYLMHIDMNFPMRLWDEILDNMMEDILDLERILSLRDTTGQIYEGMTGLPQKQEEVAP